MNKKIKSMITAGILMLQPISVFAQSSGSHGGDSRCQEFYTLASDISVALAKIGQDNVNTINPLINVTELRQQVIRPLEVLPAHHLSRQALSNPTTDVTQLDVEQWDEIKFKNKKIALVAHELMVLIKAEADGEYAVSADVVKMLRQNNFQSLNLGSFKTTPDSAVIAKNPKVAMKAISSKTAPSTVCAYLGFDKSISYSVRNAKYLEEVVILDQNEEGNTSYRENEQLVFGGAQNYSVPHTQVYKTITCQ